MTPERWKQIESIFHAASDLAPENREEYLLEACSGDEELDREVRSLLSSTEETGPVAQTLISNAAQSLVHREGSPFLGQRIDAYRITGLIGEGGMAEVYQAVRDDAEYKKEVAIKLIRKGPATAFLLNRFKHERQILASLEHPCIARFLEGGTTEDGIPYFIMEYIEGQPITKYCESKNLPLNERLQIFRQVCGAVQHAHRNLIIHRDLKPTNILVTEEGVPKLLDFGIAKLLDAQRAEELPTVGHTVTQVRLMTPEYASPEQVRGETVTTATDVYSLGAVLYELLTGVRPHQFKTRSLSEIEKVVCEQDPNRPSTAVAHRKRLSRELATELDNIVMMAMQKEPLRRYHSAEQLAEDIDRYLAGQPVLAKTPTLAYRTAKFMRRHKFAVSAAFAFFIVAIIFVAGIIRERSRAEQAREIAEREAARAKAVNEFLQRTLASADPFGELGRDVTVVEALTAAENEIEDSFSNQPEIEAQVRNTIGFTLLRLGKHSEAEVQLKRALEIEQKLYPGDHKDVAETLDNLGTLQQEKGNLEEAEALFRKALQMRRAVFQTGTAEVADSLNNLAVLLRDKDQIDEAEKLHREALEIRRKVFGPEHGQVATSLNNLASILFSKGDLDGAEKMFREVMTLDRKRWGEEHPQVAVSMNNLAFVLERNGKHHESEPIYRQVLEMNKKLLGDEHPLTATALNNLGGVLLVQGNLQEAEAMLRECLAIRRRILDKNHPHIGITLNNLAQCLQRSERCAEAEPLFVEALRIFAQSDFDPVRKAKTKMYYGDCLISVNRAEEAHKWLSEAQSEITKLKGAGSKEALEVDAVMQKLSSEPVKLKTEE